MIESNPTRVPPNKPALVLATAFGFALGLFPFLLLLDAWIGIPLVAAAAAVGGYVGIRNFVSASTFPPSGGEWILGVWSAVGGAAAISLTGSMSYATCYWVVRGCASLFADDTLGSPSTWAKWGSGVLVALAMTTVPAQVAKSLSSKLYPPIAGTRSPFFALLANPLRLWVVAILALGIVLASVFLLDPNGLALVAVLTAVLFYTSLPLSEVGKDEPVGDAERRAEENVRKLFEAAGYKAITSPKTGDAEVDPLLREVDFLAQGGEHVLAVGVKRGASDGKPADWSMGSPLLSAANVLERRLDTDKSRPAVGVRPFLVLVGGVVSESLNTFAEREGVRLLHVANDAALEEVLGLGRRRRDEFAESAAQLLGVPKVERPASRASSSLGARP